jgi:hypothetical protein
VCVTCCAQTIRFWPDPPAPAIPKDDQTCPNPAPLPHSRGRFASLRLPRTTPPPHSRKRLSTSPSRRLAVHCSHFWTHQQCVRSAEQAHPVAKYLGNCSIEAPIADAWNSTAVNRCSGARPHAVSRPQRPTNSIVAHGDRQGTATVCCSLAVGYGCSLSRLAFRPYNRSMILPFADRKEHLNRHASPNYRNYLIAVH